MAMKIRGDKILTVRVKIPLLPNNIGKKKSANDVGPQQGNNISFDTR